MAGRKSYPSRRAIIMPIKNKQPLFAGGAVAVSINDNYINIVIHQLNQTETGLIFNSLSLRGRNV